MSSPTHSGDSIPGGGSSDWHSASGNQLWQSWLPAKIWHEPKSSSEHATQAVHEHKANSAADCAQYSFPCVTASQAGVLGQSCSDHGSRTSTGWFVMSSSASPRQAAHGWFVGSSRTTAQLIALDVVELTQAAWMASSWSEAQRP